MIEVQENIHIIEADSQEIQILVQSEMEFEITVMNRFKKIKKKNEGFHQTNNIYKNMHMVYCEKF